ncbi:phage tail protein [Longispora albida]|uniref:phage tail protein n=1 Tax=Longispora albida TaxID=203523 RepID=UPI00039DF865|nr:phage tail protein [Longispora albida]
MDSRALSMIVQNGQWLRCAHDGTALLPGGGVELTWHEDRVERTCGPEPAPDWPQPSGLAFDEHCGGLWSSPPAGVVTGERLCLRGLSKPGALAAGSRQRLYIAETGAGLVTVVDLPSGRVLRKVPVCGRPVDITAACGRATVLVRRSSGRYCLMVIDGRRGPLPGPPLAVPCWHERLDPIRIAAPRHGGPLYILWRPADGGEALVTTPDGAILLEVAGATDIEITPDKTVVIARLPGQPFLRYQQGTGLELEPLAAPGYDGGAIAARPDGTVAFTASGTIGRTAGSAARHVTRGTVVSYRLDSGAYRTRWGRVFVDACLPPGTALAIRYLTSDADDVPDPVPYTPPDRGARPGVVPDGPPLPSALLLGEAAPGRALFKRPGGSEVPWRQYSPDEGFETYESLAGAEPGRYLWIELTLTGTERVTPRVRGVRIERPGHRLLDALPKSWSRDDGDAQAMYEFLALPDGVLRDLDLRSATRAVLADPHATPQEALSWLAGFAGLVLDRRWPEPARRQLIAEAYTLFRRRGTRAALIRTIGIYLGRPPVIVEEWQLRGLGGTVLGLSPHGPAAPAVGGSARQTGTLGRFMVGGQAAGSDSYTRTAHRFCLLVPGTLSEEQRAVTLGITEAHRPAHTRYELLELGPGMRVGARLRVALTSFVGPSVPWSPAVVGETGGPVVLGRAATGTRLGETSVAGRVRVG